MFTVARKIKIKDIHPAQIAVALWMKNIDKFIYGNINGIQANTRLDKSGIEKLAAKIDLQTAKNVLNSQLHEWKLTKRKPDEGEKAEISIKEVPLPMERMDHVASIFDWVSGWKSSWENNDIGKHISFYREKIRNCCFCSGKPCAGRYCSERDFVFKVPKSPFEFVFEKFNIETGNALGGFRATLFFRVFKKPRNKRGEGGMGK